ncbi:nuclear pore complex protein Nup98-Nup96 isoform X2 [Copidosoma floridanum]|uniref:nuclear pore complex protein Nup98-Nup96 isoform X2 n=1 Tax=Copidosoma floridanum TaxID=29053 RepID=UPI0006C9BEFD|nr:nuclear pore complex protein Nup98-Nup96 isoform X2 [Copidosoma floridanum]
MDYEGKLRRVSAKHDTRFLEYRPETGSWVFKVDHFSKYGLSDSDDEEAVVNEKSKKEIMKATEIQKFSESLVDKKLFTKKTCFVHSFYSTDDYDEEGSNKLEAQQKKNDSGKILSTNTIQSSSAVNAHLAGTKSHTLQLMKASFFELEYFQNDESIDQRHLSFVEAGTGLQQKKTRNSLDELAPLSSVNLLRNQSAYTNKSICDVEVLRNFSKLVKNSTLEFQPKVFNSEYQYSTDLEIFDSNECYLKCVADIGLQKKKQYKLKWSPKLTLLSCNNNTGHGVSNSVSFAKIKDCFRSDFKYFIELSRRVTYEFEMEIFKKFKDSVEQHLNVHLKYLHIEVTNSSPCISPISVPSNKDAIHEHAALSAEKNYLSNIDLSTVYFQNVWQLIESLWGTLVVTFFDSHIHEIEVLRKEALTKWFQQITAVIIKGGIQATEPKDQTIFLLLTANKVEEACNIALESGDYCLALLLSQLDGSSMVRELIEHQIELWQDAEADDYFSLSRLKLIMLIAGVKKLSKKSETVNVCEDLDWKRAFAVHLWYLAPSTASITDVLDVYDSSITADKSHFIPRPEYFNNDSKTAMYTARAPIDLCYHLIKLYCSRSYPIEVLLNPESYTGNIFDYRMSYMLHQTLIGLGYTHVPDHVTTIVYSSFAAQLETYDLWNWSILIVLNHKNCYERERAVMDLLFRHVELDNTSDYEEKENFLIKSLKISPKWINEAKAVKASTIKRYEEAAWYYIAAEKWNEAHEIIIRHIAIDAIINGDHEYLKTLLRLFISTDCYTSVSGWAYQGQLILDYITIITEINELLKNKSNLDVMYSLELLRPQLISLCTNIKMFPSNSSKNRLCQAEMSKRILQLAKGLLMSSSEEDNSNFFIQFVSQLPLPEDYAQQELRSVINGFV